MKLRRKQTEEILTDMMKRPIPRKRVGIVHLEMMREHRALYGMKRFSHPKEAAELAAPLFSMADREMMVVMSLDVKLEPLALEIAAVGGLNACVVDVKNMFKHSLLNNAAYIVCFHNHPSGDPSPSLEDKQVTERIGKAGAVLGIPLIDHIIVCGHGFYSFREHGQIEWIEPYPAA